MPPTYEYIQKTIYVKSKNAATIRDAEAAAQAQGISFSDYVAAALREKLEKEGEE